MIKLAKNYKIFTIFTIYNVPTFSIKTYYFTLQTFYSPFLNFKSHSALLSYKIFYLNKRKIIFFNIKILKMSFEFSNNKLCSTYFVIHNKSIYVLLLRYFLLFLKPTYYFVWRNLPTNSNYFWKNYTLFLVALIISHFSFVYVYRIIYILSYMCRISILNRVCIVYFVYSPKTTIN